MLTIEVRDAGDALAVLRIVASIAGGVLALGIVAMTVGLLRGESLADLRTLTANGASPRTRRAIAASAAGGVATLGMLLGTVGAHATVMAVYRTQLDRLVPAPWLELIALIIGVPLVASRPVSGANHAGSIAASNARPRRA